MFERLLKLVDDHVAHATRLRRELHQMPELGWCEEKTAAYVSAELKAIGLEPTTGMAGTGMVADIHTGRQGPRLILRADMDGLPVEERTEAGYRSRNPGYSHCCGHDGHMAVLLGTARVLNLLRNDLSGTIRLLFQPAEELVNGAKKMIEEGAMGTGPLSAVLTLHAWPGLPVGAVACKPGILMASNDAFTVRVIGRGGHAARPHLACNPLVGMAKVIETLTPLTSHERVVTICVAEAGRKFNVIPESGTLVGTCRALSPETRELTHSEIIRLAQEACAAVGSRAEVSFQQGCPPVMVDSGLFGLLCEVSRDLGSRVRLEILERPSMGSEDFSYYLEHAPGLLFRLGMGRDSAELHEPSFNFNDAALGTGMAVLSALALRLCTRKVA